MPDTTPILACRPVELDPANPIDAAILSETHVYTNSIKVPCAACGLDAWVGPRQQGHLNVGIVVCFRCAAAIRASTGANDDNVISLDNPEGAV